MKKGVIFGLFIFGVIFVGFFVSAEESNLLIKDDIKNWNDGGVVFNFTDSQENSCMLNRDDLYCKSYSADYEYVFNPSISVKVTIENNSMDIGNQQFLTWAKLIEKDDLNQLKYFKESTFEKGPPLNIFDKDNNVYTYLYKDRNVGGTFWYSGNKVILIEGENSESVVISYLKKYPSSLVFCSDGCKLDDKCVSIGYRNSGQYCGLNGELTIQLEENLQCNNNFECSSNLCIDNQCIEAGLFNKIINWFKNIFG